MGNALVSARSLTRSWAARDRPRGTTSFLPLVTSSALIVKDNFVHWLVQSEEIFQTIPEGAQFSQGHQRKKAKKLCNIDLKISTTDLPFL